MNTYQKPTLTRFGTVRELTLAGGCLAMADGANPYHRYDGLGDLSCPLK